MTYKHTQMSERCSIEIVVVYNLYYDTASFLSIRQALNVNGQSQ